MTGEPAPDPVGVGDVAGAAGAAGAADVAACYRTLAPDVAARANRTWWDAEADAYQAEHGDFLDDVGFVWGPEGLRESAARLLGDPRDLVGARVLEVGCGAAQCARWLRAQGARAVGADLSYRQLQHARRIDLRTGVTVPVVCADARALPFGSGSFDVACSAYGALPFVGDVDRLLAEVARVLRPGGRWVASVTHPVRWAFADEPGPEGLTAQHSYFDRTPYVETDPGGQGGPGGQEGPDGRPGYAEFHRTMGDWVGLLRRAGFVLDDLVEPEWPAGLAQVWGGWSPLRGRLLPGTAIFCCSREPAGPTDRDPAPP